MQLISYWFVWFMLALGGLAVGCSDSRGDPSELLVFAAASLADALPGIVDLYEAREGVHISVSYGGSQMLAQQIESGASADLLISAGVAPVDRLDARGYVYEKVPILSNKLVVAIHGEIDLEVTSIEQLEDMSLGKIAIADPRLAPVGVYAKEALESAGIWDRLQPRLVIGGDVRSTMAYLETGNVGAALVYASDVMVDKNIKSLDIIPTDTYSQIIYPGMVVSNSDAKSAAILFLKFLGGNEAMKVFRAHGFSPYLHGNVTH